MKHIVLLMSLGAVAMLIGYGCAGDPVQKASQSHAEEVKAAYVADIARFDSSVAALEMVVRESAGDSASAGRMRSALLDARLAYKQMEYMVEHFAPVTARGLNGPVLDEVEEDDPNQVVIAPEGLQVIEEKLYSDPIPSPDTIMIDIQALRASTKRLSLIAAANTLSDQNIFDAMLRQIVRVMALGLAGFDSPVAQTSIREAAAAVEGLRRGYGIYASDLKAKHPELHARLEGMFAAAIGHLESNPDFVQFDRLNFIRSHANPLYAGLREAQKALAIPFPEDRRAISVHAASIFEPGAFDPLHFAPSYSWETNAAHVELGRTLFFDPVLSGNERRACASCHRPELAFTDGEPRSLAFDFKGNVSRNAPTLINAGLQGTSFYDGRVMYLEDQATDVLANPMEMHGSLEVAAGKLRMSPDYVKLFEKAYGKGEKGVNDLNMRIAIASYIRSLVSTNSPFDRYVRGEDEGLPEPARRGFNLFMGKGKCGTCHFMPLFNGTVPPAYSKTEVEILGVTERFDTLRPKLDSDPGRFNVHDIEIHRFAFKTPTLRNIELTAPYMHNGAFRTLEEVLEFYDHGGGAGLGLDVPNQTLPPDRLNLTEEEEGDIIAFLKSLTDTSGFGERPVRLPEMSGVASGHVRSVGGEY